MSEFSKLIFSIKKIKNIKLKFKDLIKNKKFVINTVLLLFYLGVLLFLPFFLQYLHIGSFEETHKWFNYSLQTEKMNYFKNCIPLLMLFLFLYPLINSGIISFFLVISGALILGVANMQKMRILHQPLFPTDIIFFKQALTVTEMYRSQVIFWFLLIFALLITTLFFKKKIKGGFRCCPSSKRSCGKSKIL
ncbi:MAG: hypothetical protein N2053_09565 [Chitinispirillaceae bacterium]|nr:hypothetical protein [Chitinispirillaceae bacterium]